MSHLPLSPTNRLNKTESAVSKLWMLFSKASFLQIIQRPHQLSLCHVAALKSLPVIDIVLLFLHFLVLWGCRNQHVYLSSAQHGDRRREGCRICHYLPWTDSIKPSLLFSNIGSFLYRLLYTRIYRENWAASWQNQQNDCVPSDDWSAWLGWSGSSLGAQATLLVLSWGGINHRSKRTEKYYLHYDDVEEAF